MKYIPSILLLISIKSFGQQIGSFTTANMGRNYYPLETTDLPYSKPVRIESTYDTTVLFKGIDTVAHTHSYVGNSINKGEWGCTVNHGILGCPDGWLNEDIICTICL